MARGFVFLIFLSVIGARDVACQVQYAIIASDVCWIVSGQDSSLTRLTYVTSSAASSELKYLNADGNEVTVTGGSLYNGKCGCCRNGAPTSGGPVTEAQGIKEDEPVLIASKNE